MGKAIAFANQKGGVGKSTMTVQAAFYLKQKMRKDVLVIDLDSQGNTSDSLLQGEKYSGTSSAKLFSQNLEELNIQDTPYGIDLLGSEINSSEGYDIESSDLSVVTYPATHMESLKEAYDYILIDCPPSLGRKLLGGLIMADFVVCPIKLSGYAIGGVSGMIKTINGVRINYNPNLKYLGLIVNEYDDSASARATYEYLKKDAACRLFKNMLHHRAPIDAATTMGIPVSEIRNGKRSSQELEAVFKELLNRMK